MKNQKELEKKMPPMKAELSFALVVYILLSVMVVWGCLFVYNAMSLTHHAAFYAGKQLLWSCIGFAVLWGSSRIPFVWYKKHVWHISLCAFTPLLLLYFIGTQINGMRGWFSFGDVTFQPSEFAKIPFIMSLCYIAVYWKKRRFSSLYMIGVMALWTIPIILQPDYGTFAVYVGGFIALYFITGGLLRYFFIATCVGIPIFSYFFMTHPYAIRRITGFLHPERDPLGAGWHIRQFQYTLAQGGFSGKGMGQALWSNNYLPLAHSDSAFASLTESVGFIGASPVIAGFLGLSLLSIHISRKKNIHSIYNRSFIVALSSIFVIQAFLHISVNVLLLPPTGITLPLLSYGGSSLISTMLGFGLIISAVQNKRARKQKLF
jgi:cell division protein FtsW